MAQQASPSSSSLSPDTADDFHFSVFYDDEVIPLTTSHQNLSSSPSTSPLPPCESPSSKSVVEESLFKDLLNTDQIKFATEEADDVSCSIIICEICAESKRNEEMFIIQRCYHSFCSECVIKQVATKIQDNMTVVSCPGLNCKGVLELESCRALLPKELIDKWNDALCAALPKIYCPFKDCSAMLLDGNKRGEEKDTRKSECPFCHRPFCAKCHVPWHLGINCEEFQKLNVDERGREDILLVKLANKKKWRRFPNAIFILKDMKAVFISSAGQFVPVTFATLFFF